LFIYFIPTQLSTTLQIQSPTSNSDKGKASLSYNILARVTRRVLLVEKELHYHSAAPIFIPGV
jgi:hypothetical protein